MKGAEKLVLVWVVLLMTIAVCLVIPPFLPWTAHRILHSATAAAWAQTAGTVAAMLCGAGAIAWQVRFETRREARAELQRDLRAALEIQELVACAARHLKALRVALHHFDAGEGVRRHILDLDDELTWHDLREAFSATPVATIPGARLKLAFIRAKSGYANARGVYDVLWQEAHGALPPPSDAKLNSLKKAADIFDTSLEQIREVVKIVSRLIEET